MNKIMDLSAQLFSPSPLVGLAMTWLMLFVSLVRCLVVLSRGLGRGVGG